MWLLFAGLNPISESFRNLYSKKASLNGVDPLMISWFNNLIPVLLFIVSLFFIQLKFNYRFVFALSMSGLINVVATILYMKAISKGDISTVIPMLCFTPLFLLITSPILVGEFPGFWGVLGIILIVLGSYFLNIDLKSKNVLAPLKSLIINKGTRYMFIVAVLWSISANYDKLSIINSSVFQHITFVNIFIFGGITLVLLITKKFKINEIKKDPKNLILMSSFTAATYVLHMTALSLAFVAYVVSLKRSSGVISVLFGHFILDEPHLRQRLLGSLFMLTGVLLIVLA